MHPLTQSATRLGSHGLAIWAIALMITVLVVPTASAHDIWVEPYSNVVRLGESVVVQFKLGNCNEGKPDGKISGQLPRELIQAAACLPTEKIQDLALRLVKSSQDDGGCWMTRFKASEIGCNWIIQRFDENVVHGGQKVRGRMFAKAPLVVSDSLETIVIGDLPMSFSQPFELVLESSLLPAVDSKEPIKLRVLKNEKPLANAKVSFTFLLDDSKEPQLTTVVSDSEGAVSWIPNQIGPLLIACAQLDESEKGPDFDATYYSSTVFLNVSQADLRSRLQTAAVETK